MDIKPNKLGHLLRILSLLILIGTFLFLILGWTGIPDRIPGPLNENGIAETYTGKTSLITIMVINWIIFLTFSAMQRFPQLWKKVEERNKTHGHRTIKNRLGLIKLAVIGIYSYLIIYLARGGNLPAGILMFSIFLMFAVIGVFIFKLLRFTMQ